MKPDSSNCYTDTLNCFLELDRQPVGIRLLHTVEEFQAADAEEYTAPINYCVIVRMAATNGRALKINGRHLSCQAGAIALGLCPCNDRQRAGHNGRKLGLYQDMVTAKQARDAMSYCGHTAYGVLIKPLSAYHPAEADPDIVIIVSTPYNIMRLVQGYSYCRGVRTTFKMAGNQALCSELTAAPYMNNDLNVSLLCIGTRHKAGWKDDELGAGFPFHLLDDIVTGLTATANIMENNSNKQRIREKCRQYGLAEPALEDNHNYYQIKL